MGFVTATKYRPSASYEASYERLTAFEGDVPKGAAGLGGVRKKTVKKR